MGEVSPSAATACAATLSAGLAPRNAPAKESFPDLRCAVDRVIPLPLWLIETLVTLPLPQEFYLAAGSLGSGPRFPQSPCLVLQKKLFWRPSLEANGGRPSQSAVLTRVLGIQGTSRCNAMTKTKSLRASAHLRHLSHYPKFSRASCSSRGVSYCWPVPFSGSERIS